MPVPNVTLLADHLRFIQSAVSITVASRDKRRIPSLCRALACSVDSDASTKSGSRIQIVLNRSQCQQLLLDVAASQAIAAVFSEPASHRTLQVKGNEIKTAPISDNLLARVNESREHFADAILPLGYSRAFSMHLLSYLPDNLITISFQPQAIFEQSPGPSAGNPLAMSQ